MRVSATTSSFIYRSVTRRAFINQQRAVADRRFQSSTPEQKAQDALATAKNYASKFFEATKRFLGPVGDKAGQLIGCKFIFLPTHCRHLSYLSRVSLQIAPAVQFFCDERALQADLCQGVSATTLSRGVPYRLHLPLDTGEEPRTCSWYRAKWWFGSCGYLQVAGLWYLQGAFFRRIVSWNPRLQLIVG